MMKRPQQPVNVLELKPRRNVQSETDADGRIILLIPKFKNRFLAKWVTPRLSKPNFRVKLDPLGSFVWEHCDGQTSGGVIADRLKSEFGAAADPVDDRVCKFLMKLERSDFVRFQSDEPA